jgi:hypothetical protein
MDSQRKPGRLPDPFSASLTIRAIPAGMWTRASLHPNQLTLISTGESMCARKDGLC